MVEITGLNYEEYAGKEYEAEKWNNRYRISNICVFDAANRHRGIGKMLMERILLDAKESGARMVVLETQSFN